MRTFTLRLAFLLVGLALSIARASEALSWNVETALDNQIFPSLAYAMANLKSQTVNAGGRAVRVVPPELAAPQSLAKRPLAVRFNRPAPGSKAAIRVRCDELMEPLSLSEIDLGKTQTIPLSVAFNYDTLVRIRQSKPVNVDVSVSVDGGPFRKQIKTITVRTVNDCPYFYFTGKTGYDLSWMFAAYVNEDHPMVDEVLKIALSTNVVRSFDGYQSKNIDQVRDQVRSVWTALSLMGTRYSSITTTANRSEIAFSQHVRLIGESSKAHQANCVDGSVLIASVLEKIGITTELVKVPGHMYVRFWLDPWLGEEKRHYCCLETTMLGEGFPLPAKSPRAKAIEVANTSYVNAWTFANAEFDKNRDKFSAANQADFRLISVGEAQKRGIIPIPYLPSAPAKP